ncbi:DDE-type integrase/transposase/recombinase [bacterium]|nr:DDE-type integrase/transposase/recombinase [bacterium]
MSPSCVWLSVADVQKLLDISQPAVLYRINKGLVRSQVAINPGRAGKKYEIALESLPADAQERYWKQLRAQQEALNQRNGKAARAAKRAQAQADAEDAQLVTANDEYLEAPVWQKDIIDERLRIVTETYHMPISQALEWAKDQGYKVSRGTLYRWRKAYDEGGKNALATGYGNRTGSSCIPDDVFEQFCAAYMSQNQLSAQESYKLAIGYMALNHPELLAARKPSLRAFEYRLQRQKEESAIYYARHGESAWNRKYGYYIAADYEARVCGETAVSDHMQFDVMVLDPVTGKKVRPWLTAWCDWKSRKLLAWDIHTSDPCSDHIFSSFHAMCSAFGLPKNILIDNGKDYRCKDFAGGRTVTRKISLGLDEARTSSLMEDLGIKPYFALPYNAKRKNIERHFRALHNSFERHLKGYTGTNSVKRPEALKGQIKRGELMDFADLVRIAEDFIVNVFNKRVFGRNAVHAGKSPDQIWEEDNPTLRRADARTLAVFMQRTSGKLRVTRNGVKDPQLGVTYWAEEMVALAGSYVYLRRDLKHYGTAWVYAEGDDRKPLCLATIKGTVDPFADSEASKAELKEQIARQRRATKAVRAAAAVPNTATVDDKLDYLKAEAAFTEAQRGYTPAADPKVIELQHTPLDETAREQEHYRQKTGTANEPIPVLPAPKRKKIYFTRTEMECDLGGRDEQ